MSACAIQAAGTVELYFYGEIDAAGRMALERHLTGCAECRAALEELALIRAALGSRPDVAAPADGDWSGFMARLERAVRSDASPARGVVGAIAPPGYRRPLPAALAMAAVLTLVTMSVLSLRRDRAAVPDVEPVPGVSAPAQTPIASPTPLDDAGLAQVSEEHFERSKLVVLGLATKDPAGSTAVDWDYERRLATSLLSDTRLYRQAAEERGMESLAGVMRDLELLLLQTSMSETPDAESLTQLQRLIRRRDLITKMEIVSTSGLLP